MQTAVHNCDVKTLQSMFAKKVKVSGNSLLAAFLRDTYNLNEVTYTEILYTKSVKRSNGAIPVHLVTPQNVNQIDIAHHAHMISSAVLKVVRSALTPE